MSLTLQVIITRASDGAKRTYAATFNNETNPRHEECASPDALAYQWGDGNFGCDCNRALFFARAGGEPKPVDPTCGHGAFFVVIADESGKVIFQDNDHPSPATLSADAS